MCKWQYKQNQTGNNACKLFIHFFFVIASQKTEAIDWLVIQPRDEFRWQTSPQQRKHVLPQLRLAECSVMIFLLGYACYNYNTHAVGSTSKIWLLNRFQSVVPYFKYMDGKVWEKYDHAITTGPTTKVWAVSTIAALNSLHSLWGHYEFQR